jgi:hypothetical protein
MNLQNRIANESIENRVNSEAGRATSTVLEMAMVTNVNMKQFTIDAYVLDSKKEVREIPFAFPYRKSTSGMLYMPERGSVAIVGWFAKNQPIALCFIELPSVVIKSGKVVVDNSASHQTDQESLNPGEFLLRGKYNNLIHFTDIGDIIISTNSNAFIEFIEKNGLLNIVASELDEQTEVHRRKYNSMAKQKTLGVYYNQSIEDTYELNDTTVDEDIDEMAKAIIGDTDELSPPEVKNVIVRIKKGTVLDENNDIIMLNSSAVCLSIEVLDEDESPVGTVRMNKLGHFAVVADRVDITANNVNIAGDDKAVARVGDSLELVMESAEGHTHSFSVARISSGSGKVKCG